MSIRRSSPVQVLPAGFKGTMMRGSEEGTRVRRCRLAQPSWCLWKRQAANTDQKPSFIFLHTLWRNLLLGIYSKEIIKRRQQKISYKNFFFQC